jgi:quinol monooxygenase YgiN
MYGLMGRILAVPGSRDELASILMPGPDGMPGCLSYIVATDPQNPDALWVTEVWVDQAAIARGRPLIAGFDNRVETTVLGGIGLAR